MLEKVHGGILAVLETTVGHTFWQCGQYFVCCSYRSSSTVLGSGCAGGGAAPGAQVGPPWRSSHRRHPVTILPRTWKNCILAAVLLRSCIAPVAHVGPQSRSSHRSHPVIIPAAHVNGVCIDSCVSGLLHSLKGITTARSPQIGEATVASLYSISGQQADAAAACLGAAGMASSASAWTEVSQDGVAVQLNLDNSSPFACTASPTCRTRWACSRTCARSRPAAPPPPPPAAPEHATRDKGT